MGGNITIWILCKHGEDHEISGICRQQENSFLFSKKTMEINARHPIIHKLKEIAGNEDEKDNAENLAWILHDTAILNSGFQMEDTKSFASRMYKLMQSGMNIADLTLLPEPVIPDEEPTKDDDDDEEEVLFDDEEEESEDSKKDEL